MTLTQCKWLAQWPLYLALLGLPVCNVGCQGKDESVEAYKQRLDAIADFADQRNLRFRATMTFGDGHAFGQSFNFAGIHGFAEVSSEPGQTPVQP